MNFRVFYICTLVLALCIYYCLERPNWSCIQYFLPPGTNYLMWHLWGSQDENCFLGQWLYWHDQMDSPSERIEHDMLQKVEPCWQTMIQTSNTEVRALLFHLDIGFIVGERLDFFPIDILALSVCSNATVCGKRRLGPLCLLHGHWVIETYPSIYYKATEIRGRELALSFFQQDLKMFYLLPIFSFVYHTVTVMSFTNH